MKIQKTSSDGKLTITVKYSGNQKHTDGILRTIELVIESMINFINVSFFIKQHQSESMWLNLLHHLYELTNQAIAVISPIENFIENSIDLSSLDRDDNTIP